MVVLGVGTDIIEIGRISDAVARKGFLNRYYTPSEMAMIEKKGPSSAASNFAAKEAVSKAFGTGFKGFSPIDIEVLRDGFGKPYVILYGKAKDMAGKMGVKSISISLSHSKEFAVAFVIFEGDSK